MIWQTKEELLLKMLREEIVFNIVKDGEKELKIFKSGFVDAARCIIRGIEEETDIAKNAKTEIDEMFLKMVNAFGKKEAVRMYYLKKKDSDYIRFSSIYSFRIWLIVNQQADTIKLILDKLSVFCKKNDIALPKLNIVFGNVDNNGIYGQKAVYNTDVYFNNTYDKEWFDDPEIKNVVKSIDKSSVIDNEAIESPVLGIIPPIKLSGGVKTLMLIYNNPDMIFNASTCGDNCAKWIESFSVQKNFVINLYHVMRFSEKRFSAYIVNEDKVINSLEDLYIYADKYCRG